MHLDSARSTGGFQAERRRRPCGWPGRNSAARGVLDVHRDLHAMTHGSSCRNRRRPGIGRGSGEPFDGGASRGDVEATVAHHQEFEDALARPAVEVEPHQPVYRDGPGLDLGEILGFLAAPPGSKPRRHLRSIWKPECAPRSFPPTIPYAGRQASASEHDAVEPSDGEVDRLLARHRLLVAGLGGERVCVQAVIEPVPGCLRPIPRHHLEGPCRRRAGSHPAPH